MRMKSFWPLALLVAPAIVLAEESFDTVVQWNHIVGVITAPGLNNPVAGINAGAGPWSVPWDERISRRHVEIDWREGRLHVAVLPEARNPVFHRGRKSGSFELKPGDHFVIGGTTFTLADERVNVSLDVPLPAMVNTRSIA